MAKRGSLAWKRNIGKANFGKVLSNEHKKAIAIGLKKSSIRNSQEFSNKVSAQISDRNFQMWQNPEYRKRMTAVLRKNSKDPIRNSNCALSMKEKITKFWGSKDFRRKISKAASKMMRERWEDPEQRERMEKVNKKQTRAKRLANKTSVEHLVKFTRSRKGRKLCSKSALKQWEDSKFRKRMLRILKTISSPSKPQVTIFRRLCRAAVRGLKLEYPVDNVRIDIAHLPTKTAIESDGSYWHRDKKKTRARDKFLESHGWKVVHIELNNRRQAREYDLDLLLAILRRKVSK